MGEIHDPQPALLILAAFSSESAAIDWARATAEDEDTEDAWGPIALSSKTFDFTETDYYQPTMGAELKKQFLAFERLVDPGELPRIKRQTNDWEAAYAKMTGQGRAAQCAERPLNLDPGYITEAKLVLASTKDHAHRIYLADGIFAEVTLHFQNRAWRHRDWTFPDYRRDDCHAFFIECRDYLRKMRKGKAK